MSRRLTTEEFIEKSRKLHGDKYDYSKVGYINNATKVCIVCPEHGEFWQTPAGHMKNSGCIKCSYIKRGLRKKTYHMRARDWDFEQPEDYKLIPLTRGKFAKVDNEDFDRVKDINWKCNSKGYACNRSFGRMHRLILNVQEGTLVDHIYGDKLDNRKNKLRVCSNSENVFNANQRGGMSKYKGVTKRTDTGKWRMTITKNYKVYSNSTFNTEEEAARAYDKKALELFGEFAYQTLNFPELKEEYLKELKLCLVK